MKRKRWLTIGIALALMAGNSAVLAAENADVQSGGADVYEMDDTIVTAERMPSKAMETPANVAVITAKEIEANHFSSLDEAISHVNGISVVKNAGGERQAVRLNGDDRVVIMVDGQRLNDDQGAFGSASVDMNMLPTMQNIQRIEIVKGGGSALYGSDAVGGVINIITKKVFKNEPRLMSTPARGVRITMRLPRRARRMISAGLLQADCRGEDISTISLMAIVIEWRTATTITIVSP